MLRINDNDSEAGFADVNFIAEEQTGEAVITLSRLRGSKGSITVSLATLPETAMDNIDFVPIVNPRIFSADLANIDLTDMEITVPAHGFSDGQEIIFKTSTTLPAGLVTVDMGGIYQVAGATANTFQVSSNGMVLPLVDIGMVGAGGEHRVFSTVTWASGETADQTVIVPLVDDLKIEGAESFQITMVVEDGDVTLVPLVPLVSVFILDNDLPGGDDDTTFSGGVTATPGPNTNVNDIAVLTGGQMLIAGQFTEYDGIPMNRIARVNSDGTLDTAFSIGRAPTIPSTPSRWIRTPT